MSDPARKTASTWAKVASSDRSSPKRPAVCSLTGPSLTVQRTDLTELLDHGSLSQRLKTRKPRGDTCKPVLGMAPVVASGRKHPRPRNLGGREGSNWAAPLLTVSPGSATGRTKLNSPFPLSRFSCGGSTVTSATSFTGHRHAVQWPVLGLVPEE